MEIEKLTEEFVMSGKQPDFKNGFDFGMITKLEDGAELIYFNKDEIAHVTKMVDTSEIIVNPEKSILICLTDIDNEEIPNIVKNVAKFKKDEK